MKFLQICYSHYAITPAKLGLTAGKINKKKIDYNVHCKQETRSRVLGDIKTRLVII